MLFNINKKRSLNLLQLVAALFILFAAPLVGEIKVSTGIYLLFTVFFVILCARINSTQRIVVSVNHILYLLLGGYAILSTLWAGNKEGHLLYLFSILLLIAFHTLAGDYFCESNTENIKRRFMYMISISGLICAILNFFYWIVKIVPVAGTTPLYRGMGTNDFLAIFLYFSILTTVLLLKGNSKSRKIMLIVSAFIIIFAFIMAKSAVAWTLATVFTIANLTKKKSEKTFMVVSISAAAFFFFCVTVMVSFSGYPTAFPDVLRVAAKHPFGLGGGFWSARETFSVASYPSVPHVGLLAYLFASGGVLGVLACAFLMLRTLVLFLKLKNLSSFAGLLLCIALVVLPFGANISIILFLIGINAYNEQSTGMYFKFVFNEETVKKVTYVVSILLVVASMLFVHSMIKTSAENAYKSKRYDESYRLYKVAGTINVFDGESLRMATSSLRKSGEIKLLREDAVNIIEKAMKRDKNNIHNIEEKALIYDACEEFELSAQQYRDAVQKAFDKDKYNLLLAKELCKIVEKYPKGSAQTKRSYEEIIKISQTTNGLDIKKEINDIADKVFKYTKGDIVSEG